MTRGNRRLLQWGGALLLLLGLFLLLDRPQEESEAVTADPRPDLQWREGRSQQYDVRVDSTFLMTMPGAASGEAMALHLDGVLEFQTLGVDTAGVLVGMRFSSMEMSIAGSADPEVNRALTTPFRVRFDLNGPPVTFEFPATLPEELREVIRNLVRMFQVTIEQGDDWLAHESNASGNYEAAYSRLGPSRVSKRKRRYVGPAPGSPVPVPEVQSEESISIDRDSDWIAAMRVEETVITRDPGGLLVEVNNRGNLTLRATATAATPGDWRFAAAAQPDPEARPPGTEPPALSREEAERRLRADVASLEVAVKGRRTLIHRLRDLIRANGELPLVLLEMMRSGQFTDRTRADLYLAFELAGTPEAQAALASVAADASWSAQDGMRAIVALGGVADPTAETLSALWDAARGGLTGGGRDDLPGTAALALGNLGRGLRAAEDRDYTSLRADLLDGASSAASEHQRAVFLYALGNTADPDPSMRLDIVPFLDDPAPEVRSAAARTLGRLGTSAVAEDLLRSFEREGNDRVRGSIAEALASWEDPSLPAIQSVRAAIRSEQDETVRYNLAMMLGNSMQAFPENRAVLEELVAVEQSKRIVQHVSELLHAPQ